MFLLPHLLLCVSLALASVEFRPTGWLDRLVQYHKQLFFGEVKDAAKIEITAAIQPKPEGYVDSPGWDDKSVFRLLWLVRNSQKAQPVRLALRRVLRPTRRFYMSIPDSYKYFPSLGKKHPNEIYYDFEESDTSAEDSREGVNKENNGTLDLDSVVEIMNPVEARLPSRQISLRLLKEIMENRARQARILPSTRSTSTKSRKPRKTTATSDNKTTDEHQGTTGSGPQESTTVSGSGTPGGEATKDGESTKNGESTQNGESTKNGESSQNGESTKNGESTSNGESTKNGETTKNGEASEKSKDDDTGNDASSSSPAP